MAILEDPPTASSSSNDDEISSGEDQISHSSSEPKIPTTKTLKYPSTAEKTTTTTTTVESKKNEVHSSKKKRASEVTPAEDMHVKRSKSNTKSGDDNKKLNPPRFLWSEDDEIYVLQGMIDFKAETGKNPYDDMNEFYDITKKFISFDVSKIQFTEKIRSLKRKYIIGKDKKVNESSFSKPHDKKCLGLAKYIWRSGAMAPESAVVVKSPVKSNAVKSPVKSKKNLDLEEVENVDKEVVESDVVGKADGKEKKVEEEVVIVGGDAESSNWFDKSFLVQSCASLGANESCVKEKWSKVPIETKNRIKEKLKLVEAKEYELLSQKTDILKEVIFVMSEAI